ncbi:hypothetical protein SAMN05446037_101775 [Anaerovirgula multivorans]|uniref:Uncharacterized protein n=1 Tax=Anaerovirgula multivorans TaxID=312168 RepID=A0A239GL63_9FIRM|nr:hypothetical protein [Anaerovirgula multivorans]SNS70026.1 hypothetical protein SAMN05446037_101775 [Anaerovirgula multivorans]
MLKDDDLYSIFSMIKAHVKDVTIDDLERSMISAQRELIEAEAQARRKKNAGIIKTMHTINMQLIEVKNSYSKIRNELSEEACEEIETWIKSYEKYRQTLVKEKF